MNLGFDQPLYILPFDHRGSFQTKMFGWTGTLTLEQTAQIAAAKKVIYDAFDAAVAARVPKEKAGILVDEQFGAAHSARRYEARFLDRLPRRKERAGGVRLRIWRGLRRHIEAFQPTFCKVLVRYNPEGDRALNKRQADRLQRLSDYLHEKSRSLFMFELLVPAEKAQLARFNGDEGA